MSLYEKTVYPRLTEPLTADELAIHFTPSEEEIEFTIKTARLPGSRLSLMVLLKLFQKLHRFPNADEVPASVVEHLRIQLRFGAAVLFEYDDPLPASPPTKCDTRIHGLPGVVQRGSSRGGGCGSPSGSRDGSGSGCHECDHRSTDECAL
jgi:hypothetical protein